MQVLKKYGERRNILSSEGHGDTCLLGNRGGGWSSSVSLVNRPPSVVTCTPYDNEDIFQSVAKAMLFRYENEGMSEREAVLATLGTSEDKRGFLEALDLRSANMYSLESEEHIDLTGIEEVIERTRFHFGDTLRLLWRESVTGYDRQSSGISSEEGMAEDHDDDGDYRRRLMTPKNWHSPIQNACNEKQASISIKKTKSKRQRLRFFPDVFEQPRSRPRLFFDFKMASSKPMTCLRLDGQSSELGYTPPSPIATSA